MKLALLGTNADILVLAAAAQRLGHEIAWVGDMPAGDVEAVRQLDPQLVDRAEQWEMLLDQAAADVVLVGRGAAPPELRAEQLKRLAAEARPLLIVHPACDSVLPYYEVDMARRETHGLVRHYNPLAGNPIGPKLRAWVADGHPTIGPIHQVTCERRLESGQRDAVLFALARDVELLAVVAGDIRRVTAIGPRTADDSFASLQAQMNASGPASLRWSVRSSPSAATGLEMALIGERGSVILRIDEALSRDRPATWELETNTAGEHHREPLEPYDPAGAAIQNLADAVVEPDSQRRAAASTWDAATRAMEVVDAVELSLEKSRTIDVYQQQLTERLAFRGTMAALGCGLLLIGFMAVVLVTILGGAEQRGRAPLVPGWPLVLLAVLAFFLLLQMVPLLAQKSPKRETPLTRRSEGDDG